MDGFKYSGQNNPFSRPWMANNCAASGESHGGGSQTLKGLVAGGITGGVEVFISYPTEFVKTKLQLDEKTGSARRYTGFFDVIRKTVESKGVLGLYRGLSVLLFFSIPKLAVRFGTFETLKEYAVDDKGNLSPTMRVLCGLGAGVSEAIFTVTPMETIKVKFIHDQQMPNPQYHGLFSGTSKIIRTEGLLGIYRGLSATILKQGSNQAIRFYVMETLKNYYRKGDPTSPIPTHVIGVFGLTAATASVVGNNPLDVVKTRMQGLEREKYKNTLDCALQIFKNEGPLAFYKGAQTRLLRVCMDVTFTFMFYENIMMYLNRIYP